MSDSQINNLQLSPYPAVAPGAPGQRGPAEGEFSAHVGRGESKSYFKPEDEAQISEEGREQAEQASRAKRGQTAEDDAVDGLADRKDVEDDEEKATSGEKEKPKGPSGEELNERDQNILEKLKARDLEVRRHEQAHLAAAGGLANGGAHYEFQNGPDGKRYAVGGHVNIDVGPVPGDPEATVAKAEKIKRSSLAPEEPSSQDRKIAADADKMKAEAQAEIAQKRLEEATGGEGQGRTHSESGTGEGEEVENSEPARKIAEGDDTEVAEGSRSTKSFDKTPSISAGSGKLDSPPSDADPALIAAARQILPPVAAYQRVDSGLLSGSSLSFVA